MNQAPLITADELAGALRQPRPPALLDVRWSLAGPGRADYLAGHLPGAAFCDLDQDLAAPPGGDGRHPLPTVQTFIQAMRRLGVSDDRPVVAYDEADAMAAARAWWCLRYFGHRQVRVLDGGYQAWVAGGHPVETGEATAAEGDFSARPGGMLLLDAPGAARLAREGVLLDARGAERYRGEVEPVDPVAGHIPGAVSAPTSQNVAAAGQFHASEELAKQFAALGARADTPVGVYCGSGVTAAHEVLALEIAGVRAALYVGSWSHWITDPTRPIATGPEPGSVTQC